MQNTGYFRKLKASERQKRPNQAQNNGPSKPVALCRMFSVYRKLRLLRSEKRSLVLHVRAVFVCVFRGG